MATPPPTITSLMRCASPMMSGRLMFGHYSSKSLVANPVSPCGTVGGVAIRSRSACRARTVRGLLVAGKCLQPITRSPQDVCLPCVGREGQLPRVRVPVQEPGGVLSVGSDRSGVGDPATGGRGGDGRVTAWSRRTADGARTAGDGGRGPLLDQVRDRVAGRARRVCPAARRGSGVSSLQSPRA